MVGWREAVMACPHPFHPLHPTLPACAESGGICTFCGKRVMLRYADGSTNMAGDEAAGLSSAAGAAAGSAGDQAAGDLAGFKPESQQGNAADAVAYNDSQVCTGLWTFQQAASSGVSVGSMRMLLPSRNRLREAWFSPSPSTLPFAWRRRYPLFSAPCSLLARRPPRLR